MRSKQKKNKKEKSLLVINLGTRRVFQFKIEKKNLIPNVIVNKTRFKHKKKHNKFSLSQKRGNKKIIICISYYVFHWKIAIVEVANYITILCVYVLKERALRESEILNSQLRMHRFTSKSHLKFSLPHWRLAYTHSSNSVYVCV